MIARSLCITLSHIPSSYTLARNAIIFCFQAANTPCVAAHSTVRALYAKYDGPLYQVNISTATCRWSWTMTNTNMSVPWQVLRTSDNKTQNVSLLSRGGYANSETQDEFCARADCVIWRIYDQTTYSNRECDNVNNKLEHASRSSLQAVR